MGEGPDRSAPAGDSEAGSQAFQAQAEQRLREDAYTGLLPSATHSTEGLGARSGESLTQAGANNSSARIDATGERNGIAGQAQTQIKIDNGSTQGTEGGTTPRSAERTENGQNQNHSGSAAESIRHLQNQNQNQNQESERGGTQEPHHDSSSNGPKANSNQQEHETGTPVARNNPGTPEPQQTESGKRGNGAAPEQGNEPGSPLPEAREPGKSTDGSAPAKGNEHAAPSPEPSESDKRNNGASPEKGNEHASPSPEPSESDKRNNGASPEKGNEHQSPLPQPGESGKHGNGSEPDDGTPKPSKPGSRPNGSGEDNEPKDRTPTTANSSVPTDVGAGSNITPNQPAGKKPESANSGESGAQSNSQDSTLQSILNQDKDKDKQDSSPAPGNSQQQDGNGSRPNGGRQSGAPNGQDNPGPRPGSNHPLPTDAGLVPLTGSRAEGGNPPGTTGGGKPQSDVSPSVPAPAPIPGQVHNNPVAQDAGEGSGGNGTQLPPARIRPGEAPQGETHDPSHPTIKVDTGMQSLLNSVGTTITTAAGQIPETTRPSRIGAPEPSIANPTPGQTHDPTPGQTHDNGGSSAPPSPTNWLGIPTGGLPQGFLPREQRPVESGDVHPPGKILSNESGSSNPISLPSDFWRNNNQFAPPLPQETPRIQPTLQNLLDGHQGELPRIMADNKTELPQQIILPRPAADQPTIPAPAPVLNLDTPGRLPPVVSIDAPGRLPSVTPVQTEMTLPSINPAPRAVAPEAESRTPVVLPSLAPKTETETPRQKSDNPGDLPREKRDTQVEAKIQNLLSLIAELKPAKTESNNDLSVRPVSGLNHELSRSELPMLQHFMRAIDVAVSKGNIPEQVNRSFDPTTTTTVSLFRLSSAPDSLSLKDIIALNNRGLDPSDITGLRGLRGEPIPLSALRDPLNGRNPLDPAGLGPLGKIDPLTGKLIDGKEAITGIKVVDGKLDPTWIGIKGMEAIDPKSIKIGEIPSDKTLIGTDRKDIADKKEGESDKDNGKDLISMLAANDKTKGKKPEKDGKDDSETKDKKEEQQTRRKYIVREGDTLESIAEKIIGDSRFSLLLEMINRGGIRYKWEGSNRKPLLRVGQIIWLPTPNEVKAHRAIFFTRNSIKKVNNELSQNDSAPLPAHDDSGDTVPVSQTEQNYVDMPTVEITATDPAVDTNASASSEPQVEETYAEETYADRICVGATPCVAQGEKTKHESNEKATASAVQEKSANSSKLTYTPSYSEIQELLTKMKLESAAATQRKQHIPDEQTGTAVLNRTASQQTFRQLDLSNRIVIQNENKDENFFSAKLEREIDGIWTTVAYYESRGGKSVRYLHRANGARRAFYLNLPPYIVKEMAIKDFNKNWKSYGENFERQDPVRPKPMSYPNADLPSAV